MRSVETPWRGPSVPARVDPAVIGHVVLFIALAMWSWRKWPDPLIDFGRELYTPWQLATGKVLYRDVASLFGPFSQYFNAFWFFLFGASFTTLIFVNLIVLALLLAGMHHLLRTSCDRFTATAATLVTMLVFGFSQYAAVGNYNFVSPYSHEASHSLSLSVGIMVALFHGIGRGTRLPFFAGGVLFGCLLLTKPETSLAMIVALGVAFGGWLIIDVGTPGRVVNRTLLFVGSALIPPVMFFAFFWFHLPAADAIRAVGGAWWALLTTAAAQNRFYVDWLGFDRPMSNALRMVMSFGGFLVFVALAWWIDRVWPKWNVSESRVRQVTWRGARIALLIGALVFVPWFSFPRALPMVTAAGGAVIAVLLYQKRHDRDAALRLLPLLVWGGFALVMLAKMILNARVYHYGFYLALPATVFLIVIVTWLIPTLLQGKGAEGRLFRSLAALLIMAGVAMHLAVSNALYRMKVHSVGAGADHFLAFDTEEHREGRAVNDVLKRIEASVPVNATLAVFPEGAMINYLARRSNPTPYITLMVPELRAFGEVHILAALAANPPDYVALAYRDSSEYGVGAFGTDPRFGKQIMDWVKSNYRSIDTRVGDRPHAHRRHQIEIMKYTAPGR